MDGNTKMPLWKDNKISGKYEMSYEEIRQKFKKSKYYGYWGEYWLLDRALSAFISEKEENGGLSSVWEKEDFEKLMKYIDEKERR